MFFSSSQIIRMFTRKEDLSHSGSSSKGGRQRGGSKEHQETLLRKDALVIYPDPDSARVAFLALYDHIRVENGFCSAMTFATEQIVDQVNDPGIAVQFKRPIPDENKGWTLFLANIHKDVNFKVIGKHVETRLSLPLFGFEYCSVAFGKWPRTTMAKL